MNLPNKKKLLTGMRRVNRKGYLCELLQYVNSKNVRVRIVDTGETVWTDFRTFKKGLVMGDTEFVCRHTDCSFGQAKFFVTAIGLLIIASVASIIYYSAL